MSRVRFSARHRKVREHIVLRFVQLADDLITLESECRRAEFASALTEDEAGRADAALDQAWRCLVNARPALMRS